MADMFEKLQDFFRTGKSKSDKRERIFISVNKEDILMKQIDEFKEKAMELQQMLDFRENRMQELSQVVNEREEKARKLQHVLEQRKQEADRITKEVEECVTLISRKLEGQIGQLSRNIEQQIESLSMANDAKIAQVSVQFDNGTEMLANGISAQRDKLDNLNHELPRKLGDNLGEQILGIKTELLEKQDTVKAELSEKVHTENVKSYRNMQTLIEELEAKLDAADQGEKRSKSVTGYLKAAIVLGVLNLLAMAGLFLYEMGILNLM